jgi:hypothetical protein
MAIMFGAGTLTLPTGNTVADLQECTIEIEGEVITLAGTGQMSRDVAQGEIQIKGTAKTASLDPSLIASALGTTATNGAVTWAGTDDMGTGSTYVLEWEGTYEGRTFTATVGAVKVLSAKIAAGGKKHAMLDITWQGFLPASGNAFEFADAAAS